MCGFFFGGGVQTKEHEWIRFMVKMSYGQELDRITNTKYLNIFTDIYGLKCFMLL